MKKLFVLLLIFALSRSSVTFGNPSSGLTIRDYFFGNSAIGNSEVNQVLALLVGPEGRPGPVGVAGRDGFDGINGLDGRDGLPGAPGPVGPQGPAGEQGPIGAQGLVGPQGSQGAPGISGSPGQNGTSVVIQQVAVGDASQCGGLGGTKFIAGLTISYACNGPSGAPGPIGPRGPSGSSSTTSGSNPIGQGGINIGSCDVDGEVTFEIRTYYRGDDFILDGVKIKNVDSNCLNSKLSLYFKIKSTGSILLPNATYSTDDLITCSLDLAPGISQGAGNALVFEMPASTPCTRESGSRTALTGLVMSSIGTRDLSGLIGFEIVAP